MRACVRACDLTCGRVCVCAPRCARVDVRVGEVPPDPDLEYASVLGVEIMSFWLQHFVLRALNVCADRFQAVSSGDLPSGRAMPVYM